MDSKKISPRRTASAYAVPFSETDTECSKNSKHGSFARCGGTCTASRSIVVGAPEMSSMVKWMD
jgi:hypothetical protein